MGLRRDGRSASGRGRAEHRPRRRRRSSGRDRDDRDRDRALRRSERRARVLRGEGDRTLSHWREVHERYWREHSENPRGFEPDMPVVCERFRLLLPPQPGSAEAAG
nr:ASCH domain-containing protein [Microbacterium sp. Se5.02b]